MTQKACSTVPRFGSKPDGRPTPYSLHLLVGLVGTVAGNLVGEDAVRQVWEMVCEAQLLPREDGQVVYALLLLRS